MKHVLLATEAFEGLGHIAPWKALVHYLTSHGARVSVVCPNPAEACVVLDLDPALVHQAWWPSMHAGPTLSPTRSWEELLLTLGYGSEMAVSACLKRWRHLLELLEPDVMLADYAPLAMVAARSIRLPIIEAGGGFCVPPVDAERPVWLPFMEPKDDDTRQSIISGSRLAGRKVTSAINAALERNELAHSLRCFTDIFRAADHRCITTGEELDHYAEARRPGSVLHVGSLALAGPNTSLNKEPPGWEECDPQRLKIACYLKESTPRLDQLFSELFTLKGCEILWLGKAPNAIQQNALHKTAPAHFHFPNALLNLDSILSTADVLLTNGGIHTLSHALNRQTYCILLPMQVEQASTALRLAGHPLVRTLVEPGRLHNALTHVLKRNTRSDLKPKQPLAESILGSLLLTGDNATLNQPVG